MSLDRRELLKRSGVVTAGIAVGGSIATHTVAAQDETAPEGLVFWSTWTDEARGGYCRWNRRELLRVPRRHDR